MAIAIKGANALVTYLDLPSGPYFISNVAHRETVGVPIDRHEKLPIVISQRQVVSPSFCDSSSIDHSDL